MNGDRWRLADAGKRRPVRGGMPVNEFARYAERSRQFTDRHERIIYGINHTQQAVRSALSVHPRLQQKAPRRPCKTAESLCSIFKESGLRRAPRRVTLLSR
jgi:hypothetical protein